MSEFKIPKRFKLFGQTITVVMDFDLERRESFLDQTKYSENKIILQSITENMSQETQEDTFMHELLHQCLDYMGRKDLSEDERLIFTLAGLLHQALTTAEYE